MKRFAFVCLFLILGLPALFIIGHRVYFQFRPIPVVVGFTRSMTPAEKSAWVARMSNWPPPEQIEVQDSRAYLDPTGQVKLAPPDLFVIRAMASWTSSMPWRSTEIEVRSSSEVMLHVFERHHTRVRFTKDESGWHMKPIKPSCIFWASENAKPVFSFH